jgi:hypothetical protein
LPWKKACVLRSAKAAALWALALLPKSSLNSTH